MSATQIEFEMRVPVCAWCQPVPPEDRSGLISHGICPRHLRKIKVQLEGSTIQTPRRRSRRRAQANSEALLPGCERPSP